RTVNPAAGPGGAFGPRRRGYQKAPHFKVAVSRHCVRFLFEVGREYPDKPAWVRGWKREGLRMQKRLGTAPELAWFKDEHDEDPAAALADLDAAGWKALGDELTRTRDGQVVLGLRVGVREAGKWRGPDYEKAALDTFAVLGECFKIK